MEENEYYAPPESRTFKIIKKVLGTFIVAFVFVFIGALLLRIMFADYYPKSMKGLYFTDELLEHYTASPEDFAAYRLDADYRYIPDLNAKGENVGNFFAANLIFVPENGSVQCFVRYNRATLERLNEEYGLSLTSDNINDEISISLFCSHGAGENGEAYAGPTYQSENERYHKVWIYNYIGLCFEDVDIESAYWMRLEIRLTQTGKLIGTIPLYNADSDAKDLEKINFRKSELPR